MRPQGMSNAHTVTRLLHSRPIRSSALTDVQAVSTWLSMLGGTGSYTGTGSLPHSTSGGRSWGERVPAPCAGRGRCVRRACACPADTPRCHLPRWRTPLWTPGRVSPPGTMAPAARHVVHHSMSSRQVLPLAYLCALVSCEGLNHFQGWELNDFQSMGGGNVIWQKVTSSGDAPRDCLL